MPIGKLLIAALGLDYLPGISPDAILFIGLFRPGLIAISWRKKAEGELNKEPETELQV